MDYDIIGDVHGHAEELTALLSHLGYRQQDRTWSHPSRQALFVGDFIDRGPRQADTVAIVQGMVGKGSAQAIMGNHEFNAIAWHTPDPHAEGEHLRRWTEKNRKQHQIFLDEYRDQKEHDKAIEWFLTLPIWLELPELRLVHACWSEDAMAALKPLLTPQNQMTRDLMVPASRPGRIEFWAAECLTKGIEVPLPRGRFFLDKDGHERRAVRTRWWDQEASTYPELALMPDEDRAKLPNQRVTAAGANPGYEGAKPVFFGHYWMQGRPELVADNAVCVDYSVAKKGKLVAYRFEAGAPLSSSNFTWVGA